MSCMKSGAMQGASCSASCCGRRVVPGNEVDVGLDCCNGPDRSVRRFNLRQGILRQISNIVWRRGWRHAKPARCAGIPTPAAACRVTASVRRWRWTASAKQIQLNLGTERRGLRKTIAPRMCRGAAADFRLLVVRKVREGSSIGAALRCGLDGDSRVAGVPPTTSAPPGRAVISHRRRLPSVVILAAAPRRRYADLAIRLAHTFDRAPVGENGDCRYRVPGLPKVSTRPRRTRLKELRAPATPGHPGLGRSSWPRKSSCGRRKALTLRVQPDPGAAGLLTAERSPAADVCRQQLVLAILALAPTGDKTRGLITSHCRHRAGGWWQPRSPHGQNVARRRQPSGCRQGQACACQPTSVPQVPVDNRVMHSLLLEGVLDITAGLSAPVHPAEAAKNRPIAKVGVEEPRLPASRQRTPAELLPYLAASFFTGRTLWLAGAGGRHWSRCPGSTRRRIQWRAIEGPERLLDVNY